MNLLIDIGNSRIKWAVANGTKLGETHVAPTRPFPVGFAAIGAMPDMPARIVCANVAGAEAAEAVTAWANERYSLTPVLLQAEEQAFGVRNAYGRPERLGADRWAALIGARWRSNQAVCVIDCGTAITVDLLDDDGHHRGGLIGPGVATMRRALYGTTAGIADEGEGVMAPLAADTRSAVTAGTLYMAAAFIDRARTEIEAMRARDLPCLLTGGDATVVAPLLSGRYEMAPDLVLEGLAVIAA
ncbi:MAG TPA: type III pantothenate kinase [Gammaproteobacteria bacterium]|nr:type III pantothenate kinase [Gammaproteobacteria bacterium]